jgi:hypothetical protein
MKQQLNEVKRMQQLAGIKLNEDEIDDFSASLPKAGSNQAFVVATDEDNHFEIDDEIRAILKKYGADENNFQILAKANIDSMAGEELKDLEKRGVLTIRPRTKTNEGYHKMGKENQMEADTSLKNVPREIDGAYQVEMDWMDNKQHFLSAIETVKKELEKNIKKYKYGVKLAGKFKKGNPNYPDGGVVKIIGDYREIIDFLASEKGGQMGSEQEANEYMDEFGELRPDRFR